MSTIYYHVAAAEYRVGSDLICRDELAEMGTAPEWHWDDADEGTDGHLVCLFAADQMETAQWMLSEITGSTLLRIDLPADHELDVVTVEEGGAFACVAVAGRIPARYITRA